MEREIYSTVMGLYKTNSPKIASYSLPQTVPFISLLWKAWEREEEAEQLSMSCYTEIKTVICSCLLCFEWVCILAEKEKMLTECPCCIILFDNQT